MTAECQLSVHRFYFRKEDVMQQKVFIGLQDLPLGTGAVSQWPVSVCD